MEEHHKRPERRRRPVEAGPHGSLPDRQILDAGDPGARRPGPGAESLRMPQLCRAYGTGGRPGVLSNSPDEGGEPGIGERSVGLSVRPCGPGCQPDPNDPNDPNDPAPGQSPGQGPSPALPAARSDALRSSIRGGSPGRASGSCSRGARRPGLWSRRAPAYEKECGTRDRGPCSALRLVLLCTARRHETGRDRTFAPPGGACGDALRGGTAVRHAHGGTAGDRGGVRSADRPLSFTSGERRRSLDHRTGIVTPPRSAGLSGPPATPHRDGGPDCADDLTSRQVTCAVYRFGTAQASRSARTASSTRLPYSVSAAWKCARFFSITWSRVTCERPPAMLEIRRDFSSSDISR